MSKNLRKCMNKMHLVCDSKCPKLKKSILADMSKDNQYFRALYEIVHNIKLKNIKLTPSEKKKFKKYIKFMEEILKKPKNVRKRRQLVNQSGGFLPIILPILTSVISGLIGNAIS